MVSPCTLIPLPAPARRFARQESSSSSCTFPSVARQKLMNVSSNHHSFAEGRSDDERDFALTNRKVCVCNRNPHPRREFIPIGKTTVWTSQEQLARRTSVSSILPIGPPVLVAQDCGATPRHVPSFSSFALRRINSSLSVPHTHLGHLHRFQAPSSERGQSAEWRV